MANNKFQIKRTTVSGNLPNTTVSTNTSYILPGELALNLSDFKMVSSNGSTTFEIGSNVTTQTITNQINVGLTSTNTLVQPGVVAAQLNSTTSSVLTANGLTVGANNTTNTLIQVGIIRPQINSTVYSTLTANGLATTTVTAVNITTNGNITAAATANSSTFSHHLNYNPESGIADHSFLSNDLGNLRLRGGNIGANTTVSLTNAQFDALFSGTPSYGLSGSWANATANTVLEFVLPANLQYSAAFGISFGNASWAPNTLLIEAYSQNTWVTLFQSNTYNSVQTVIPITGNAGVGTQLIRFTIGANTTTRISNIWGYQYSSAGWNYLAMPRAGGTMYGGLTVNGSLVTNSNIVANGIIYANVNMVAYGSMYSNTGSVIVGNTTTSNAVLSANTLTINQGSTLGVAVVNTTIVSVGNSTVYSYINTTSYSGTANNSLNLGGVTLATLQSQIAGNAASAFTNAVSIANNTATAILPINYAMGIGSSAANNTLSQLSFSDEYWHDIMAFGSVNPVSLVEVSNGSSWNSISTSIGQPVFARTDNTNKLAIVDGTSNTGIRYTWSNVASMSSGYYEWVAVNFTYQSPSGSKAILVETSSNTAAGWVNLHTSNVTYNGATGFFYLGGVVANNSLRITIQSTTGPLSLSNLRVLSRRGGDQGGGREISFPYSWDAFRNVQFANVVSIPSINLTGTVLNSTSYSGTANNATNHGGISLATLQGQITGNAATAYTNAVSGIAAAAGNAYSNATAYSSNASHITSGTLSMNVISNTGTANTLSFLRGDGEWANLFMITGSVSVMDFGAKGDGVTDDTSAFQNAISYAYQNGIGNVIVPGTSNNTVYLFAANAVPYSYGTWTNYDGTAYPFMRGLVRLMPGVSIIGSGAKILLSGGRSDPQPGIFYTDFWTANLYHTALVPNTTTVPIMTDVRISGLEIDGNWSAQNFIPTPGCTNQTVTVSNAAVNTTTDYISLSSANTTFPIGTLVTYTSNTSGIGGLANGANYVILNANSTAFQLAANLSSSVAMNLNSIGTGTSYTFSSPNQVDFYVWQWAYAIALLNPYNVQVDNCVIHGWRGDAIHISTADYSPYFIGRNVKIISNEVYNVTGEGITMGADGFEIADNYIHGDGYWVAGMDIESLGEDLYLRDGVIRNNVFDFRDGLCAPEAAVQWATNSAQNAALRVHQRRAVSFGNYETITGTYSPYNTVNDRLGSITFEDNTIYQGTIDGSNQPSLRILNNRFYGFYENCNNLREVESTIMNFTWSGPGTTPTQGIRNYRIEGNIIEYATAGHGISLSNIQNFLVKDNTIKYVYWNAFVQDGGDGIFEGNIVENIGHPTLSLGASIAYSNNPWSFSNNSVIYRNNIIRSTVNWGGMVTQYTTNASVNTTSDTISIPNANSLFQINQWCGYSTNGTSIGGLSNNSYYAVVWSNSSAIALGTSQNSPNLNLTSVGSGNISLVPYGPTIGQGFYLNHTSNNYFLVKDNLINNYSSIPYTDVTNSIVWIGNHTGINDHSYYANGISYYTGNLTCNQLTTGPVAIVNGGNGASEFDLFGGTGQTKAFNFFNETGNQLQYQFKSQGDGSMAFTKFANGTYVTQDMVFTNTGSIYIIADYTKPIRTSLGQYLWSYNGNWMTINGSAPTGSGANGQIMLTSSNFSTLITTPVFASVNTATLNATGAVSLNAVTASTISVNNIIISNSSSYANTASLTVGQVVAYANMQGGRSWNSYDLNSYPNLYETRFVNLGGSNNVPSGMSGSGYWFGMGAGDTSGRGFDLMGTSISQLWYRDRQSNTWNQLITANANPTFTQTSAQIILNSTNSTSYKTSISFRSNGVPTYELGVDLNSANSDTFYLYDNKANSLRLFIDPNGNVNLYANVTITGGIYSANVSANLVTVGNSTVYTTINTTAFSGTANNSTNFGGITLSTLQSQITGNAATAYTNAVSSSFSNNGGIVNGFVYSANGIGYTSGSGGLVTQTTSRTTGVTLNKPSGVIQLVNAAGTATWQTFTVTNSFVGVNDVVRVVCRQATDLYQIHVTQITAGSFNITFATTGGTTTEQPYFNFAVIKGSNA